MKESTEIIKQEFDHSRVGGKKVATINPPVYKASTILFDSYEDMDLAGKGKYQGIYYGTNRLPNQRELEENLNLLERASVTRIFPSGISAIRHTLLAFLKSGDHILVCDNVYGPTKMMCKYFLPKFQIETDFIPSDSGGNIEEYIRENTKLIFIESPGSITFEIQDLDKIKEAAEKKEVMVVMDNTWATPLYFKPLDHGIDVSIQSITKYISGHSDILMGSVSINEKYSKEFDRYYSLMGISNTGDDCYRALKGLKTLELRLGRHEENAMKLASWLQEKEIVKEVLHPGLESHAHHNLWKKYFKGSSGLFAFIFNDKIENSGLSAFMNSLKLFGKGFSWGGYKSLVSCGKIKRDLEDRYNGKTIVRVSAGLENIEDLKKDFEIAIKKAES